MIRRDFISFTPKEIPTGIINLIRKAVNPEKIICFGIRSTRIESWSSFLPTSETQTSVTYDLLILTRADEKRTRHELLDRLDNVTMPGIVVNSLVHNINTVNEVLMNGSPFFETMFHNGLLFYEDQSVSPIPLSNQAKFNDLCLPADKIWRKCFALAEQFLKGASHLSSKASHRIAAFMLHQAVEHTCIALIRAIIGYRPSTHNLRRLIAITENFTPLASSAFPRNTPEEKNLFLILARAYVDARYKEDYHVDPFIIHTIIRRVSEFQGSAESLYRDRILSIQTTTCPISHQENDFNEKHQA